MTHKNEKYIHSLTGLRGFAALIVFVSHAANEDMLPSWLGHGFGQIGVMLFFMLSGFLIAHLYSHLPFTRENIKKYASARIGRVLPLYFLLIAVSSIICLFWSDFAYDFSSFTDIIKAVFFLDAPQAMWTIPVEIQFYVLFLAFWFLKKYRLLFVFLMIVPGIAFFLTTDTLIKVVFLYAHVFFLGVMSSIFYTHIQKIRIQYVVPVILLLFFFNLPGLKDGHYYMKTWLDPATLAITYLLFIAALREKIPFLKWRPLTFMGEISYGFYLIHAPLLVLFTGQMALAFFLTLGLSILSYKFIELPAMKATKSSFYRKVP